MPVMQVMPIKTSHEPDFDRRDTIKFGGDLSRKGRMVVITTDKDPQASSREFSQLIEEPPSLPRLAERVTVHPDRLLYPC